LVLSVLPDTEVCFEDVDVFFFLFFLCLLWYGVVILADAAAGVTLSQRVIVLVLGVLLFHRLLFSLSSSLSLDIKTLGPCMEAWSTLLVYAVSTIHQLYHSGSECLVMCPLLSVCCKHLHRRPAVARSLLVLEFHWEILLAPERLKIKLIFKVKQ
jgi:hypothetical protein